MVTTQTDNATAKHLGRASIVNSILLPTAAAFQLNVTFWVLVVTNFVLLHAIWLTQFVQRRIWHEVDFGSAKWPLIAFVVLGNLALLLWSEGLLSVFAA